MLHRSRGSDLLHRHKSFRHDERRHKTIGLFLAVQTLANRFAPTVQQRAADAVLTGRGRRLASPRKAFCDNPQLLILTKALP